MQKNPEIKSEEKDSIFLLGFKVALSAKNSS